MVKFGNWRKHWKIDGNLEIDGKAGYHILYDKKAGDIMWFEFNDDNWVIASKLSHLVAGEEGLSSSSAASCGLPGLNIHAKN